MNTKEIDELVAETGVPIPSVIMHDEEKVAAFHDGWLHSLNRLEVGKLHKWCERFGVKGESFHIGDDVQRNNPLENVFCWGYFAQRQRHSPASEKSVKTKLEKDVERAESTDAECNIGESHTITLCEMFERMARNPAFIPRWAWNIDDEDTR